MKVLFKESLLVVGLIISPVVFVGCGTEDTSSLNEAASLGQLDNKLSNIMGYTVSTDLGYNNADDRKSIFERLYPIANSPSIVGKNIELVFVTNGTSKSHLADNGKAIWLHLGSLKSSDDILDFFDSISQEDIERGMASAEKLAKYDEELSKMTGYRISTDLGYNSPMEREVAYNTLRRIATSPVIVGKNIDVIFLTVGGPKSKLDDTYLWLDLEELDTSDKVLDFFRKL